MLLQVGLLDETYIVFTSDHGYHLGQFNQVKGKSQPYESDIRIPLFMRGPRIPKGVNISSIALNIDLAPTFLDIANANVPSFIDGTSLMNHAASNKSRNTIETQLIQRKVMLLNQQIWKDTFLIERGRLNLIENNLWKIDKVRQGEHLVLKPVENLNQEHNQSANKICQNYGFPMPPCSADKKIICYFKNEVLYYDVCLNQSNRCSCKDKSSKATILYTPLKSTSAHILTRKQKNIANSSSFNKSFEIDRILLHLDKKFKRIKQRVRKYKIKSLKRVIKRILNTRSASQIYPKNISDDVSKDYIKLEKKRIKDKFLNWQNSKIKAANFIYKVASKIIDRVKRKTKFNLDRCICPENKIKRKKKFNGGMNCFHMNKDHWKVPPLWTGPSFTACTNSPNSTYWCLRTINATHNFLYCEFITGFKEYFNVNEDPYQLHNIVSDIHPQKLDDLHRQLNYIRKCKSSQECHLRAGRIMNEEVSYRKLK